MFNGILRSHEQSVQCNQTWYLNSYCNDPLHLQMSIYGWHCAIYYKEIWWCKGLFHWMSIIWKMDSFKVKIYAVIVVHIILNKYLLLFKNNNKNSVTYLFVANIMCEDVRNAFCWKLYTQTRFLCYGYWEDTMLLNVLVCREINRV